MGLARADDGRGHAGFAEDPREGDLDRLNAEFLADFFAALRDFEIRWMVVIALR